MSEQAEQLNEEQKPTALDEAAIEKLIKQRVEEEVSGLKKNRNDIMAKYAKKKDELNSLKSVLDKIDIDEYNELRSAQRHKELVEATGSKERADYQLKIEHLAKDLESKTNELKQKQEILEQKNQSYNQLVASNSINSALDGVSINPSAKQILLKHFIGQAEVREIDGQVATVFRDGNGIDVNPTDYIKQWSETDEAKAFMLAPQNGGGGAIGGRGSVSPNLQKEYQEAVAKGDTTKAIAISRQLQQQTNNF